ncbi:UDP-N-acetylmuramate dehydrogenase [Pseudidiomarina sp. E22-M8]|uniref:UDP-N-acetylmuramate dehydrogenase n=1 Tax=Pseudidiomarina sp. E22-M8 TaxID=3424768 RepID=UPI00403C6A86
MTTIHKFVSLKELHTFRLPYSAQAVIELTVADDLVALEDDYYVLGEGSNTIFTEDFASSILRVAITGYESYETESSYELRIGAGENWHKLVVKTLEQGMPGLENLALIPGSVGAAPVQNIGAYGVEAAQFIRLVEAWDRQHKQFVTFAQSECCFAYRDSLFKQQSGRYVITYVSFSLPKSWQPNLSYGALSNLSDAVTATEVMNTVIAIRNSKLPDPAVLPNAGSFFKNPIISRGYFTELVVRFPNLPHYQVDDHQVKVAAGWLIDHLGLKGVTCGGAAVHDKQALVLVNKDNAVGADLLCLADTIKEKVQSEFAIKLEIEVRLLNNKGLISI